MRPLERVKRVDLLEREWKNINPRMVELTWNQRTSNLTRVWKNILDSVVPRCPTELTGRLYLCTLKPKGKGPRRSWGAIFGEDEMHVCASNDNQSFFYWCENATDLSPKWRT